MKVLVGAFSIESNSFVPSETRLGDFERQVWRTGTAVTRDCAGPVSELAGAWDAFVEAGIEPVGSVAAVSSPGAPVARDVFDAVGSTLLEGCTGDVDGVYLMLHGSALVTGEDDPEGTLLGLLRGRLGPDIPIAISLDLHAYMTEAFMANVDIVTAYRTCPHIDLYRTGHQAGEVLARAIKKEIDPVCRWIRLPMITPPERHDSTQTVFSELQSLCAEAEAEGALAAALLCTQPWLDVPELGWSAVVTWNRDPDAAAAMAASIAKRAWQARYSFVDTSELPVVEALDLAFEGAGPVVIADMGDATNGGSLGDSTEILRGLIHRRNSGVRCGPSAVTVVDPSAVEQAARVGEGGVVELTVGAGAVGDFNEATSLRGVVERVWEEPITYTHPAAEGVVDDPGPAALVAVGDISVIVHSRPVRVIDPAIYLSAGIDIATVKVVQAKSHVSYRAGFDPVTAGSVLADTKGPTAANLTHLPFVRRPRPLFPFEDVAWPSDSTDQVDVG